MSARRTRSVVGIIAMFALGGSTSMAWGQTYNANMPEAYEEPGANVTRSADVSFGVETIDPFTGALKMVVTDLTIPSNGGLDLSVIRNYQSFEKVNGVSVPERNYQRGRTATGIGWDLHFGRLWRGNNGASAPQLTATNTTNGCRVTNVTSRDNPVLELPDGSRQLFAASNAAETNFAYISAERWILRCLPTTNDTFGDGGAIVISPDGVQYTFNLLHRVSSVPISGDITQIASNYAFHVTKITSPNGTSITINYVAKASSAYASLSTVSHSEGHSISFTYANVGSLSAAHLTSFQQALPAGQGGTRTWTFNYIGAVVPSDSEYLESVVRPDGRRTSYEYNGKTSSGAPNPNGVFSLRRVTAPLGGIIDYTYAQQTFPQRDALSLQPYYVITKKEVRRRIGGPIDGTYTYNYRPAQSSGQTRDFTDVAGPTSCVTYEHESAPVANSKWRIGLLITRTIAEPNSSAGILICSSSFLRRETNTWVGDVVADQDYFRPPGLSDPSTYAPRLSRRDIQQDGTTYSTQFNSPDPFGNPQQIVETGVAPAQNGTVVTAGRTTNLTYFTNTTAWIINRKRNETVVGAGPTYATPTTTTPATSDHVVTRNFYTSGPRLGLLQNETRAGVTTAYDYFTSGASLGEMSKMTDANGVATTTVDDFTTNYSNYKRGTPRSISRSIDGTTTNNQTTIREINDTGTLAWEQDGETKQTSYAYDGINDMTGVTTARTDDADVVITRQSSDTNTDEVVTRGAYREVRQRDGFGAITRTDWSDTTPGSTVAPIFQKTDYDAEGRVVRAYLPNSTSASASVRTEYDALDRPTRITHPDNSFRVITYLSDNRTEVTDERGFKTLQHFRSFGDPSQQELMRTRVERGDAPGSGLFQVTYIDRNKIGQALSVTQEGVTRTFKYNPKFFLFEESHPEVGAVKYTHDAVGNVLTRQVASSGITSFTLDRLYRLDFVTYPDTAANVNFDYYKNNQLRFTTKGGARWDYLYDLNNNLSQEKLTLSSPLPAARTYQFDYGYDVRDARQLMTYPSGLRLDYAPDVFGRSTQISAQQSGVATTGFGSSITHHANGQLNSLTLPNGLVVAYGQDSRLRPSTFVTTATINGAVQRVVDRLYGYDVSSNVTGITDFRTSANSKSMSYDGLNRLRSANGPWGSGSITYHPNNNINTKTFGSETLTLNYDAGTNRLSSVSGTSVLSFTYDVYGNAISTGRTTFGNFAYDDDSLLRFVRDASGTTRVENAYDGNRRRVMERYLDGWSTRYAVYSRTGPMLYEEDLINFNTKDHVYLEGRLMGTRTRCTSSQDSDGDGINDCTEFRLGTNKASASDALVDTDSDGLTNLIEVQTGTDIYKADTDADGLSDSYERNHGLNALVSDSNSDTDGDGLSNLQEAQGGTNPTNADTDGDGIPDNVDPNPLFNPAVLVPILELLLND